MYSRPLTQVIYGAPGSSASHFQASWTSSLPVDDVAERLRAAIEAADLWVLHEINPQTLLRRAGYEITAARQILFFHPDLMARLLTADPNALLEAPLKFAVLALPEGSTAVRWADPVRSLARYENIRLVDLGRELASSCQDIVSAALEQDAPVSV